MGGGSQTTSNTQTNTPNQNAMNAYMNVLGGAQNIVNANQNWNPATGVRVADWTGAQNRAMSQTEALQGGYGPAMAQAANLTAQAGQGITGADISQFQNPYTQQVINATMANAQQQQGAQLQNVVGNQVAQNALGGDRAQLQKAMTEGQFALANNQTMAGLEQSGYSSALAAAQAQKGQELQAAYGMQNIAQTGQNLGLQGTAALYGMGSAQQGQYQNVLNAATQNAQSQQMWPYQNYQWLANIAGGIGSLMGGTTGGYNTTEQHPGFANYLGMGLGGISAMSDERLKEGVERVGELYDGQPVYAFNYKGDPMRQIGLLAHDVEKRHPEATGEYAGYKTVEYGAATRDSAKRGHFADGGIAVYDPWGDLLGHPMQTKDISQQQQQQQQPQQQQAAQTSGRGGLFGLFAEGGTVADPWGDLLGHPMQTRDTSQQQQQQQSPGSQMNKSNPFAKTFADGGTPWGGLLNKPIKSYGSTPALFPAPAPSGPGPQSLTEAANQTKQGAQAGKGAGQAIKSGLQQIPGQPGAGGGAGAGGADAAGAGVEGAGAATEGAAAGAGAGAAAEGAGAAGAGAAEGGGGLMSLLAMIFAAKGGGIERNQVYHDLGHGDPHLGYLLDALSDDEHGEHAAKALGHLTGGRVRGSVGQLMKGFPDGGEVDDDIVRGPLSPGYVRPDPEPEFVRPENPRGFTSEAPAAPEPAAPIVRGSLTGGPDLEPERRVVNGTVTGPLHDFDREPPVQAERPVYPVAGQPPRPLSEAALPLSEPRPPVQAERPVYPVAGQPPRPLSEAALPLSEPRPPVQAERPVYPVAGQPPRPLSEAALPLSEPRPPVQAERPVYPVAGQPGAPLSEAPLPLSEAPYGSLQRHEDTHTWNAFKDWVSSKFPPQISDEQLAAVRADYAQKQAQTGQSFKEYLKAHIPEFDADALAKRAARALGREPITPEEIARNQAERAATPSIMDQIAGVPIKGDQRHPERATLGVHARLGAFGTPTRNEPGDVSEYPPRPFGEKPKTAEELAAEDVKRQEVQAALERTKKLGAFGTPTKHTPGDLGAPRPFAAPEDQNFLQRLFSGAESATPNLAQRLFAGASYETPEQIAERSGRRQAVQPEGNIIDMLRREGNVTPPIMPSVPSVKKLPINEPQPGENIIPAGQRGEAGRMGDLIKQNILAHPDVTKAAAAQRAGIAPVVAPPPAPAAKEPGLWDQTMSFFGDLAKGDQGPVAPAARVRASEHPKTITAPMAPTPVAPAPVNRGVQGETPIGTGSNVSDVDNSGNEATYHLSPTTNTWTKSISAPTTENAPPRPVQTTRISPSGEEIPKEQPITAGEWTYDAAANKWTKQVGEGSNLHDTDTSGQEATYHLDPKTNQWTKSVETPPAGAAAPAATRGVQAPVPIGPTTPAEPGAEELAPAGIPGQGGPQRMSDNGHAYLKHVENFSPKPYWDHGQVSIGYGTRVKPGDKEITEEEATQRLQDEVKPVENWINQNIKGNLTQGQYDMLVSVGYNAGIGQKVGGKGALVNLKKEINDGDWPKVYDHIRQYNKAADQEGGDLHVVPGLINRRENDIKLGQGEKAVEGVARLPAGQAKKLPAQVKKAEDEAAKEQEKNAPEPAAHTQARRGLLEGIFGGGEGGQGGWNPLEGITGPRKAGEESWNPLGFTSQQRQNLMMAGLGMAGGNPLGWQAFSGGVSGLQAASGMQTAAQQRELAPAELAIKAAQVPKFGVYHSVDPMTGLQTSTTYDVHTGQPMSGPGAMPGGAGAPGAAGAIPANLHGQEALNAFPASRQGELRGVVSGDIPITNYRAGPQREFWENAARQVDENWSPTKITARNAYREGIIKQSSTEGKMAHSLNTGTQHLGSLLRLDPHLSDHSAARAGVENWAKEKFGNDPYLGAWDTESDGLADEVSKLQGGGAGDVKSKEKWKRSFSADQPRAVRLGKLNAALDILDGHLNDMDRKYQKEVGQFGNPHEIASPENRAIIQKARDMFAKSFGGKEFPAGERGAAATQAPAAQTPQAAPQVTLPEAKQVYKAAMAAGRVDLAAKVVERAAKAGIPPEQLTNDRRF